MQARITRIPEIGSQRKQSLLICLVAFVFSSIPAGSVAGECVIHPGSDCEATNSCEAYSLPRLTLSQFDYVGAFTFPGGEFGDSSMMYASPVFDQSGGSLFITGHNHHDAIAEFIIPELVNSTDTADLNSTGDPVQNFVRVLDRAPTGNPEGLDQITGMKLIDGKLVVNAIKFYDGDSGNVNTTLVIEQSNNLADSPVRGFYNMNGSARSAGWISPVPEEWQAAIGTPYMSGFSSATSIISRHSVGPSAHALAPDDIFNASTSNPGIETTRLMEFSLDEPLSKDLRNEAGGNDLWTFVSGAWYGFIVPGTRTYAAFGYLAGAETGIGYKITQNDGNLCGGYCPPDADDEKPYYWLFDVNDLLAVKNGERTAGSIKPYEYGVFPAPFQPEIGANRIRGGSFDEESGTLYLAIASAHRQGRYTITPVIVAYRFTNL